MKRFVMFAATALLLTGCGATAPSYQAFGGPGGGYNSQQIDVNRYVVSYIGGKSMKKDAVAKYALLRAAEVTLETGNEWFAVISSTTRETDAKAAAEFNNSTAFQGTETVTAGGAGGASGGSSTVRDPVVGGSGTFGGFGGSDVPYQAMERWEAQKVTQTVMIIQVGSGDGATFPGATAQPEIFDAKTTADEIRGTAQ